MPEVEVESELSKQIKSVVGSENDLYNFTSAHICVPVENFTGNLIYFIPVV